MTADRLTRKQGCPCNLPGPAFLCQENTGQRKLPSAPPVPLCQDPLGEKLEAAYQYRKLPWPTAI